MAQPLVVDYHNLRAPPLLSPVGRPGSSTSSPTSSSGPEAGRRCARNGNEPTTGRRFRYRPPGGWPWLIPSPHLNIASTRVEMLVEAPLFRRLHAVKTSAGSTSELTRGIDSLSRFFEAWELRRPKNLLTKRFMASSVFHRAPIAQGIPSFGGHHLYSLRYVQPAYSD